MLGREQAGQPHPFRPALERVLIADVSNANAAFRCPPDRTVHSGVRHEVRHHSYFVSQIGERSDPDFPSEPGWGDEIGHPFLKELLEAGEMRRTLGAVSTIAASGRSHGRPATELRIVLEQVELPANTVKVMDKEPFRPREQV